MQDFKESVHNLVKEKYGEIATGNACGCSGASCCGPAPLVNIMELGNALDYSLRELSAVPTEANLGLGCGNPLSRAGLKEGEVVLDLGSGAGIDAFIAARQVGASGRVIGVDMTPEMVQKATANASRIHASNVEFRLGQIENLPLRDDTVDVVISNCVINLSPDKSRVFGEIFRVLKPGGRIIISDVLRSSTMPSALKNDPAAFTA